MKDMQYQNIVAAIDGSKATIPVLTAAVKSAIQNHAHLDLLTIEQIGQITDGYITDKTVSSDQTYSLVQATEERLEDLKMRAWKMGLLDVSIHIRFGNPKQVIAKDFPKDHHNDLIVIGTTGLSSVERFVLGSVTNYVNRNALCDVLVVRTEDNNQEALVKNIVAGVVAHVDAGKTTLSEALLYRGGTQRQLGRVDNGDSFLDPNTLEKQRGITIFSHQASVNYDDFHLGRL